MPYFMYVALQGDDKILTFKMDPDSGKLELQEELAISGGPAPLAVDPQRRYLYAGRRESKELSSFSIDQKTAGLRHIGTVPLETDSVYLATDRKGRFLLSAYYEGSMVTVHTIGDDGAVMAPRSKHCPRPGARTPSRRIRPTNSPSCPTSPLAGAPTRFFNFASTKIAAPFLQMIRPGWLRRKN